MYYYKSCGQKNQEKIKIRFQGKRYTTIKKKSKIKVSCASADNTSTGEYTINDDYNDIYNNILNFKILKSNDLLKRHVFSYYLSLQYKLFLFGKTLYSFETSKTKPTSGKLTFKSDLQTVLSI